MKTEIELKQYLVKMLPETVAMRDSYLDTHSLCRITTPDKTTLVWISNGSNVACPVLETELLHLCWLVEMKLTNPEWWKYVEELTQVCGAGKMLTTSASWQQRVHALMEVLKPTE